jgi:hypothetical protein
MNQKFKQSLRAGTRFEKFADLEAPRLAADQPATV